MYVRTWKEYEEFLGARVPKEESELMEEPGEARDIFAAKMFNENDFVSKAYAIDDYSYEDIELNLSDYMSEDKVKEIEAWFESKPEDYLHGLKEITAMLEKYM